jgi:hypothetical protein
MWIRNSSFGIATGYGAAKSWFDSRHGKFPVASTAFRTAVGPHPASYPIGTGTISQEVKLSGREADHSPLSSAKVNNIGSVLPLPP